MEHHPLFKLKWRKVMDMITEAQAEKSPAEALETLKVQAAAACPAALDSLETLRKKLSDARRQADLAEIRQVQDEVAEQLKFITVEVIRRMGGEPMEHWGEKVPRL